MRPDIVRGDRVIGRQIFGPFTGGGDLKAAGPRPVDQLADERRLVAISERIDHSCGPRLFGEQRAGQRVGFDVHHDDVLFRAYRRAGVGYTRCRYTRCFDDDLYFGMSAGFCTRGNERGFREPRRIPADRQAGGARSLRVEIGNDHDLEAGHRRHLPQKHRAEFAGADQPDPHRPAFCSALLRQAMEVHDAMTLYSAAAR